jgi:hypothetical protein
MRVLIVVAGLLAAAGRVGMAQAGVADGAGGKLSAGFAALDKGKASGDLGELRDAELAFDDAVHDAPRSPAPLYGRALVKLALAAMDAQPKATAGQGAGESNYAAFVRDASLALKLDPGYPPLITLLTTILPAQGDREQPAAFVAALERAAGLPGARPDAHLVVGRAYRTAGDDARALSHFDAYLAQGGDPGVAGLERARALAGMGRLPEARAAYLAGIGRAGPAGRGLYREDLEWIAAPAELAAFDSAGAAGLVPWLERFWSTRDAAEVRTRGERLQEHLRRWAYAYHNFRIVHPENRTQFERVRVLDIGPCSDRGFKSLDDLTFLHPDRLDDLRRRERIVDHRAVIYLRHGEPWQRRRPPGLGVPVSELALGDASAGSSPVVNGAPATFQPTVLSEDERLDDIHGSAVWLYWFDGAPRVFFFAGSDALGRGRPTTLYAQPPLDPDLMWLLSSLDPAFERAAARLQMAQLVPARSVPSARCFSAVDDVIAHTRGDIQTAVTHDSYTLLFRRPLGAILQTFAMGRPSADAGRIVVTFAVDGAALAPSAHDAGRGYAYPLTFRVSAIDSATGAVFQTDTTRTFFAADSLTAGRFLSGLVEVPVPAGRYSVRVAVFQPERDAGTSVQRTLAALDDASPSMSDIVIGVDSGGIRWANRGDPVEINALGAYPRGGTAPIYYELFGLVPGHRYRTSISLRRYGRDKAAGPALVFIETADAASAHLRRSVGLDRLSHGQYVLSVTVKDAATGGEAMREQLLNVR